MDATLGSVSLARRPLLGRSAVLLLGMWVLGLVAMGSIVVFEKRVDETRRAQVVIADLRNEQGALTSIAFAPALAGVNNAASRQQATVRLAAEKRRFNSSVAALAALGHGDAAARIAGSTGSYFRFVDRIAALVANGAKLQAAREFGQSEQPGGAYAMLLEEFAGADRQFGSDAARSREVATIGTAAAVLFLLLAFSVALHYTVRARRRSQHDATIDALTGLGNRRKLFADMESGFATLDRREPLAVGMFDLDGFKHYNDTFGHPAGDALLARLGNRLAAAVGNRGSAYRIGGDEFVIMTPAADGERMLDAAQEALSERGAGYSIGCSRGGARILAGVTLEQALHVADQRLYANKRSVRGHAGTDAKGALLQVLAEQDENLVEHLGHVADLAELTATGMHLTSKEVALTRLAAELHDVGKAAIPASILDKPGALDEAEMLLMRRHSAMGERIVAAAPGLEAIGPIVRAAHERPDGSGYPDGLHLAQIPLSARIIAVVDAFDAMTSDRPYRDALPVGYALEELRVNAGTQFDPAVVDAFAAVIDGRIETLRAA